MFKRHHSLKYIYSRSKQMCFTQRNPSAPWLTKRAIRLIDQLLKPTDKGLEFGSGRSTKWLAKRSCLLYSVENDQKWFQIVNKQIKDFDHVMYYLRTVNESKPGESKYLEIFDELKNDSIDFILNDGKLRGHVALASICKVKPSGIIIIDNAERYLPNNFDLPMSMGANQNECSKEWLQMLNLIDGWRRIWTQDGVSSTLILFKP